jgi:LysM repeat protein
MSLQEKYQAILELANQNGTTYSLSEAEGVLHIDGNAPSEEAKQQLWDKYNEIDPDYRSGDLMLNVNVNAEGTPAGAGGHTYTVEAGDNLTKIGTKYGISWQQIYQANQDILKDPDKIYPGQELKIPIG